jgi:transposase
MIWLTGQLAPDFKTIADFRKDNGKAIREVCREFVALCRKLDLLGAASVAIDGSKFKAVNARDKNFTEAKMKPGTKRRWPRVAPGLLARRAGVRRRLAS